MALSYDNESGGLIESKMFSVTFGQSSQFAVISPDPPLQKPELTGETNRNPTEKQGSFGDDDVAAVENPG
jgi:hypothetical protein